MIVIPSLDIRDSVCLSKGGISPTSFARRDPNDVLRSLVQFGFSRFHIADPESQAGRRGSFNPAAVLLSEHAVQFQVCGDTRRRDQIDDLLSAGASFVVIGPNGDDDDWLGELITDDSRTIIIAAEVKARRRVRV